MTENSAAVDNSFENIEIKFIEQEHRLIPVWRNFYNYCVLSRSDPARRNAALRATISWFFSPSGALTIVIPIGGIIGILFAWEANNLLRSQNNLITEQNQRLEEQNQEMRVSRETQLFTAQLVPLLEEINSSDDVSDPSFIARINTFSQLLEPYHEVEIGLKKETFSRERGLLLRSLYAVGFPLDTDLPTKVNFQRSHFSEMNLTDAELSSLDFSNSNLREVSFLGAKITNCDFSGSYLPAAQQFFGTQFDCNLENAIVPTKDWLDEIFEEQHSASRSLADLCMRGGISADFDRGLWSVQEDQAISINGNGDEIEVSQFRIVQNPSRVQLLAMVSDFDRMATEIDELFPQDPDIFGSSESAWISSAVASINEQRHYQHTSSVEIERGSRAKGIFLERTAEHFLNLQPLIRQGAKFNGALLEESNGEKIHLSSDYSDIDLRGADLVAVDFSDAILDDADFEGARLPPASSFEGTSMVGAKLGNSIVPDENWLDEMKELTWPSEGFDAAQWEIQEERVQFDSCDLVTWETGYPTYVLKPISEESDNGG